MKLSMIDFIIKLVLLIVVCIGTLFANSSLFVEDRILPKWLILAGGLIIWIGYCIIKVIFRINGNQRYNELCLKLVFGCVFCGISIQALIGILQYLDVLYSVSNFKVVGSFDNPAGFSACLCAGFPVSFYFIRSENIFVKWMSVLLILIIVLAVILSISRSGILSMLCVLIVVFICRFSISKGKRCLAFCAFLLISVLGLYFLKKNSADGRLLIWKCTWDMILEKPIIGYGENSFKANYMNFQAKYFKKYPDSKFVMLADNINRPFNEYLLLLCNYGFSGLLMLFIGLYFLWKSYKRTSCNLFTRISIMCLFSVLTFAFFSYPLHYPFVNFVVIMCIYIIVSQAEYKISMSKNVVYFLSLLLFPIIIFSAVCVFQRMRAEVRWCEIAKKSQLGETKKVLPIYNSIYPLLSKNELFLYNYAAELNISQKYSESLYVALYCEKIWADYYLQMLIADNYLHTCNYSKAEEYYIRAADMCPVKFMPLYKLFGMYIALDDVDNAKKIAKKIVCKPVKLHSPTIRKIKNDVEQKLQCL